MPYLDSNQDVRSNELYNKAIMGAAIIVGGAALGQTMGKNIGKFLDNWGAPKNGKDVLKGLYGDTASKFGKEIGDSVTVASRSGDGPQHEVVDRLLGGKKVKRTDGNFLSRMADNYNNADGKWYNKVVGSFKDNDVAAFNTRLKDISRGNINDGVVFSDSKLSIYEDIMKNAHKNGINIDSKQGINLTNSAYNSKNNYNIRNQGNVKNLVDDAELTNAIWDTPTNNKPTEKFINEEEKNYQNALKANPVAQDRLSYARNTAELNRKDVAAQLQYQGEQERKANTRKSMNKLNQTERNIKAKKARQGQTAKESAERRSFLGSYADNKHTTRPNSFFGKNGSAAPSVPDPAITRTTRTPSNLGRAKTINYNGRRSGFDENKYISIFENGLPSSTDNPKGNLKGSWNNAKKFNNYQRHGLGLAYDFKKKYGPIENYN